MFIVMMKILVAGIKKKVFQTGTMSCWFLPSADILINNKLYAFLKKNILLRKHRKHCNQTIYYGLFLTALQNHVLKMKTACIMYTHNFYFSYGSCRDIL